MNNLVSHKDETGAILESSRNGCDKFCYIEIANPLQHKFYIINLQ